jgi:hypothetical protein
VIVGVVLVAGFGIADRVGGDGDDGPPAPSLARVEPVDLVVHNSRFGEPPPRLEILLHNTGGRRAVISRARIEIRRVGLLRQCVSQGDLPLSTTYAATLPAAATPGDVVEAPLHEQLGADEAGRFAITLGVRADPTSSGYSSEGRKSLAGLYLFELAVSLVSDEGGRPVDVGRALVSLPSAPDPPRFYWNSGSVASLEQFNRAMDRITESDWPPPATANCWISNTRILRGMLSADAKRSPTLEAVAAGIVTPDISALEAPHG